jgi:hypothetical protein
VRACRPDNVNVCAGAALACTNECDHDGGVCVVFRQGAVDLAEARAAKAEEKARDRQHHLLAVAETKVSSSSALYTSSMRFFFCLALSRDLYFICWLWFGIDEYLCVLRARLWAKIASQTRKRRISGWRRTTRTGWLSWLQSRSLRRWSLRPTSSDTWGRVER